MVLRRWGSDTRQFGLSTPLINQIFEGNKVDEELDEDGLTPTVLEATLRATLRAKVSNGETYRGNNQKLNSAQVGLGVKQITTYFVWLNINLFTRKSVTLTVFRLNAAFGAQNLRKISKLRVTK